MSHHENVILSADIVNLIYKLEEVKPPKEEAKPKRKRVYAETIKTHYETIIEMSGEGKTSGDISEVIGYSTTTINAAKIKLGLSKSRTNTKKERIKKLIALLKGKKVTNMTYADISKAIDCNISALSRDMDGLRSSGLIISAGAGHPPKTEWIGANEL